MLRVTEPVYWKSRIRVGSVQRSSPGLVQTGLLPLLIRVVTSHDQALNLVIIPLNPVTTLFN